jgi:hypothetical protein
MTGGHLDHFLAQSTSYVISPECLAPSLTQEANVQAECLTKLSRPISCQGAPKESAIELARCLRHLPTAEAASGVYEWLRRLRAELVSGAALSIEC